MSKRKLLLAALALCMVSILALGTTLAYLTDDEQVTNTMVIGNVQINIEETVKTSTGSYEKFENDKFTLYPVASETFLKDYPYTAYNKIVRTFNTSPSKDDAYIRTIILFEVNEKLPENFVNEGKCCPPGLHFHYVQGYGKDADGLTSHGSKPSFNNQIVTINNNKYYVVEFTEENGEAIAHGESLYAMSGVWADEKITSEQMLGWGSTENGENGKLDIIVFSQGIQAEGLTHEEAMEALGEVNQENLTKWLTGEDKADDAVINDYVPAQ